MVARWFLGFALALQVFASVGAAETPKGTDYRNWTYEKQKSVVDRWGSDIQSGKKNAAYLEKYASGKMDAIVDKWNENDRVRNLVRDSGVDPDTGRKIRIEANVTQTANKAKVAEALAERFKNAGKYAKNLGKASLPGFVGTAAFHGLMNGVDYVMDPENNTIIKKPNSDPDEPAGLVTPSDQYGYFIDPKELFSSKSALCSDYFSDAIKGNPNASQFKNLGVVYSDYYKTDTCLYVLPGGAKQDAVIKQGANPAYDPSAQLPQNVPATDAEIVNALKKALESNNPALAAAIAEAIKAAYTPDNSEGQSLVDIPSNGTAMDATDSAVDAVRKAGKSTGEEPTSGGKPGYYKITDGDKTIEGYVYPTDGTATGNTDSTTVTNPDGSTTTTGSTSLSWPNFCDWAGVVCEFIDWVKEDEPLEEEKPEEIDDSIFSRKFDIDFEMGASCPPNPIWNFEFVGRPWSKEIDITMVCDFFKYLGYALLFASNMTALWIVYSAVVVRDQA